MTKHTHGLVALVLATWPFFLVVAEEKVDSISPGLIATFQDDVRSVSEIVALPELGLAAEVC